MKIKNKMSETRLNMFLLWFLLMGIFVMCASAQEIAYESDKDGTCDIWVMNSDGSAKDNLSKESHDPFDDFVEKYPRWSPDGKRIMFISDKSGCQNVWIMDANGLNDFNVTEVDRGELHPYWHPSGTKIFFARNTDFSDWKGNCYACRFWEIFSLDLLTGDLNRLTTNNYREEYPIVSPDGEYVVYAKSENANDCCNPTDIWIMRSDGEDEQPFIGDSDWRYETPGYWSRANDLIFFHKPFDGREVSHFEIAHVDRDKNNYARLTYDNFYDFPTSVSPDGQKILFTSIRNSNYDVYVADINDMANPIRLTFDTTREFKPDWKQTFQVDIDIKPGSFPNSINLGNQGNVPVAIFSTDNFDATTVDPMGITLSGARVRIKGKGTPAASFVDMNDDGLLDLMVHVDTTALELSSTDTKAILEGETFSGVKIRGEDTIRVLE